MKYVTIKKYDLKASEFDDSLIMKDIKRIVNTHDISERKLIKYWKEAVDRTDNSIQKTDPNFYKVARSKFKKIIIDELSNEFGPSAKIILDISRSLDYYTT